LSSLTAPQLGAIVIEAALERAKCPKEAVDEVYMGAVLQVLFIYSMLLAKIYFEYLYCRSSMWKLGYQSGVIRLDGFCLYTRH
jgi:hypothetical protein